MVVLMSPRHQLTRAILRLILAAAVLSAPVFLIAEEFDRSHSLLVLASNGICALLCVVLLKQLRSGKVELCARILVYGLMLLVGWLASANGEDVHVNVVNFVLVSVLASVLLSARELGAVALVSSLLMSWIAYQQAVPPPGEELFEARLESIAQFLPTYLVVVSILWLRERSARAEPEDS